MINNDLNLLKWEFKIKSKVLMEICNALKIRISPFETTRTIARQKWLVAQGKSWTLKSKHLEGKAVDRVFNTTSGQPTWIGKYPSVHYVGFMCGVTPIYNSKKQLIESCHLQDDGQSIATVMKKNSARWGKETKKNQTLLSAVNNEFRKYWYK